MLKSSSDRPRRDRSRVGATLAIAFAVTQALACNLLVNTDDLPSCSAHSECIDKHGPESACVASRCVALLSSECTSIEPPSPQGIPDNAVLLGFVSANSSYGAPQPEGAAVAAREIEDAGLTGNRKLRLVMCKHDTNEQAVTAAEHLVNDLHLPAIVGTSYSGATIKMFQTVAQPKGVLMMSPSATSPDITNLENDVMGDLLWRTAPSDLLQAELLKILVREVSALEGTDGSAARVQVYYKDDNAGEGLRKSVLSGPNELVASPNVRFQQMPNDKTATDDDWAEAVADLGSFAPHIILALGTEEFSIHMLPLIERQWPPTLARPWYVMPEGNRVPELAKFAASSPDYRLEDRVLGAAPGARRSPSYNLFASSFYGKEQHAPGNLAEFAYDAVYLLAYAFSAKPKGASTGENLAAALKTFSCPEGAQIGVGSLNRSVGSAQAGACFNFEGASGPLEFDNATGEAASDIAMWCLRDPDSDAPFEPLLWNYYQVKDKTYEQDPGLDLTKPGWCKSARSSADTISGEGGSGGL